MSESRPAPPGWYPDPSGEPGSRWWDGQAWTEQVQRPQQAPPWSQSYAPPSAAPPGYGYTVRDPATGEPTSAVLAGFWRRAGGALLDGVILSVVDAILRAGTNAGAGSFLGLLVGLVYTVALIGGPRGQTVGMMAAGVRAISADDGGPISYGRAAVRYVVAIVSGFAVGLGYLWMLWDPRRQTWHDKAANNVVIRVNSF